MHKISCKCTKKSCNSVRFPFDIKQFNGTTYYMIKGDHNDVPDPYWVIGDQITQRVLTINGAPVVIPSVGYVNLWFRGL